MPGRVASGVTPLSERGPRRRGNIGGSPYSTGGNGFDPRVDGITLGVDRAFGDFVFGSAAGAGWGDADLADDRSRQDASQRSLMLSGRSAQPACVFTHAT